MPAPKETERPLEARTFPAEMLDRLRQHGFEVTTISSEPERIRVLKDRVAALFERLPGPSGARAGSRIKLAQPPGYIFRGEIGRLWDAGYQKFWLLGPPTDEPFKEPRMPALAEQLKAVHRFTEELKHALGVPSLYNESLGSINKVTAYDRLMGRGSATRQKFT